MGGRSYFHILVKWGVIIKCYGGEKFKKLQSDPPTIKHKRVPFEIVMFHLEECLCRAIKRMC